jgi:hypothetical protein
MLLDLACTSGCLWPKAIVKPPVRNPGPKIEIPHLENHILKVFKFRSWKPRVWKSRPQSWDPKSWKPCLENHILKFPRSFCLATLPCPAYNYCPALALPVSHTDERTHRRTNRRTQRGVVESTPQITGAECRVRQTDARTHRLREFIYKIRCFLGLFGREKRQDIFSMKLPGGEQ